jgi:hypothetical protein
MALRIEMVVNRSVDGDEFLQTSHPPKSKHGPLSSSKWLVRILGSIIKPAAGFLFVHIADHLHRRTVGTELVGDEDMCAPWRFMVFQRNFIAALPSRRFVTKLSRIYPS